MKGMVSFVSSGPGDPELLTMRAIRRLQAADVVLYDDLASGPVLEQAGPQAELIAVGKRAGRPSAKQESVNALLVEHARAGRHVVRLKSGDSGLFGRLEEELTALREAGIGYEWAKIEDDAGERYWIYRAGDGEDAATGSHRWFLHGVFG